MQSGLVRTKNSNNFKAARKEMEPERSGSVQSKFPHRVQFYI